MEPNEETNMSREIFCLVLLLVGMGFMAAESRGLGGTIALLALFLFPSYD